VDADLKLRLQNKEYSTIQREVSPSEINIFKNYCDREIPPTTRGPKSRSLLKPRKLRDLQKPTTQSTGPVKFLVKVWPNLCGFLDGVACLEISWDDFPKLT
jgi:hypothetical protein